MRRAARHSRSHQPRLTGWSRSVLLIVLVLLLVLVLVLALVFVFLATHPLVGADGQRARGRSIGGELLANCGGRGGKGGLALT